MPKITKNSKNHRREKINFHFKPFSAVIFIFMMFSIAQISFVSAFEFDNVKHYDEITKTATINNCDLWALTCLIEGDKIADITLKSEHNQLVIQGKDRLVAWFDINSTESYKNFFGDFEIYNLNSMKKEDKKITLKYQVITGTREIPVYKTVCQDCKPEIERYESEDIIEWHDFDISEGVPKGITKIGIFTDVEAGDRYEWIGTFAGRSVEEWSEWTDSLTYGLSSYYKFEETSGTVAVDSRGNDNMTNHVASLQYDGLINYAYGYSASYLETVEKIGVTDDYNFTISCWANTTVSGSYLNVFAAYRTDIEDYIKVGMTNGGKAWAFIRVSGVGDLSMNTGTYTINDGGWHLLTLTGNTTRINFYVDSALDTGGSPPASTFVSQNESISGLYSFGSGYLQFWTGGIDECGYWNRTLSQDEVTQLYNGGAGITYPEATDNPPTVTLNSPDNYYNTTGSSVIVNCSATDDYLIQNISLFINGEINETTTDGADNFTEIYKTISSNNGTYEWTCQAEDNSSQISWATTNYTFTIDQLPYFVDIENQSTYDNVGFSYQINASDLFDGTANYFIDDTTNFSIVATTGVLTNATNMNATISPYFLNITINDSRNQQTSQLWQLDVVSSANPITVTLNSPPNNNYTEDYPVIVNCSATVSAGTLSYYEIFINGSILNEGEIVGVSSYTAEYPFPAGDGIYEWTCRFTDDSLNTNFAISNYTFTFDGTNPVINMSYPINISYAVDVDDLKYTYTETNCLNAWYSQDLGVTNSSPVSCGTNFSGVSQGDGGHKWTVYINDTLGHEASSSVSFSQDTLPPSINVTIPLNNTNTTNLNTNINFTYTEAFPDSCWWTEDGGATNNSLTNCDTNITGKTWSITNHTITVYINDTSGNQNSSSVDFTILPFTEGTINYENYAWETSQQKFNIEISTVGTVISVTSQLIYNGTYYQSTQEDLGSGQYNITNNIDIPLVSMDGENKSFLWSFQIFLEDGSNFNFNTSELQQNVSAIYLDYGNPSMTNKSLNFSVWDEPNRTRLDLMSFDSTFNFWFGSGTVKKTKSIPIDSAPEVNISIYPENETFYIDSIIEYNTVGEFNGTYNQRNYYFQNYSITNNTQNIKLFLLKSSESTSFIQRVVDTSQIPKVAALIYQQRYYPGDNTYETVAISRTNHEGESIGFYKTEIPDYRHIITLNGTILKTTERGKIFPQTTPYTLTFTIGENINNAWETFQGIPSLTSSLEYDNDTQVVTYEWIDILGTLTIANLTVEKVFANQSNVNICSKSSELIAGILTCNLTGQNGTFIAIGYIGRSPSVVDKLITITKSTIKDILATPFLLLFIILLIASIGMGLFYPPAGIVLTGFMLAMGVFLGIVAISWIFVWAIIAVVVWILIETNK